MATQSTTTFGTRTFDKELNEDIKNFHAESNAWTQARNAITNSKTGDIGALGNEPANLHCMKLPVYTDPSGAVFDYTIVGIIHITDDRWLIYSTVMSPIPSNITT